MKKYISTLVIGLTIPYFAMASFDTSLSYGMSGNDVYQLQDILAKDGCLNVQPTGFFGLLTLDAVKCWQNRNGIANTGYVGTLTRAALNKFVVIVTASSTENQFVETGTTTAPNLSASRNQTCPIGYICTPKEQTVQETESSTSSSTSSVGATEAPVVIHTVTAGDPYQTNMHYPVGTAVFSNGTAAIPNGYWYVPSESTNAYSTYSSTQNQHPQVLVYSQPKITSFSVIGDPVITAPVSFTQSINTYTASFKVQVAAGDDSDIALGMPGTANPAFSFVANSSGQTVDQNLLRISYSQPTNTVLSTDKMIIIPRGGIVTIPVTVSFTASISGSHYVSLTQARYLRQNDNTLQDVSLSATTNQF